MIPIILGVILVAGLIAYAYSSDQELIGTANSIVGTAEDTIKGTFKLKEDCNPDGSGSCVAFFANTPPEQHQDIDAGYDIENVEDVTYYENGTAIPESSYATGIVSDTSYSKTGVKQTESYVGDEGQMLVKIGNIATIQGQIKIYDENANIIEPRYYDYWIDIRCHDTNDFCNEPSFSPRGTTQAGGNFIEKWTTNFKNTEGLYEITITADADMVDSLGRPYETTGKILVELYK